MQELNKFTFSDLVTRKGENKKGIIRSIMCSSRFDGYRYEIEWNHTTPSIMKENDLTLYKETKEYTKYALYLTDLNERIMSDTYSDSITLINGNKRIYINNEVEEWFVCPHIGKTFNLVSGITLKVIKPNQDTNLKIGDIIVHVSDFEMYNRGDLTIDQLKLYFRFKPNHFCYWSNLTTKPTDHDKASIEVCWFKNEDEILHDDKFYIIRRYDNV